MSLAPAPSPWSRRIVLPRPIRRTNIPGPSGSKFRLSPHENRTLQPLPEMCGSLHCDCEFPTLTSRMRPVRISRQKISTWSLAWVRTRLSASELNATNRPVPEISASRLDEFPASPELERDAIRRRPVRTSSTTTWSPSVNPPSDILKNAEYTIFEPSALRAGLRRPLAIQVVRPVCRSLTYMPPSRRSRLSSPMNAT
jgi:hypothetical protein